MQPVPACCSFLRAYLGCVSGSPARDAAYSMDDANQPSLLLVQHSSSHLGRRPTAAQILSIQNSLPQRCAELSQGGGPLLLGAVPLPGVLQEKHVAGIWCRIESPT